MHQPVHLSLTSKPRAKCAGMQYRLHCYRNPDSSVPLGRHATSFKAARDEAVWLQTELAKAKIVEGDQHLLVGLVKDDANRAIYRPLLTVTCTKLG